MALKRKRSSATVASPISDCSEASAATQPPTASALPFFYPQTKPVDAWIAKPTWSFPTYEEEPTQMVNSRTRKRHRDDRPDEQAVYETTINKLYSAQRSLPNAQLGPSLPTNPSSTVTPQQPQRSTLHSFWQINQPPADIPMAIDPAPHSTTNALLKCADCDRPLQHEDSMDLDHGLVEQEAACDNCQCLVCDGCAVMGDHRICLPCATNGGR